MSFSRYIRIMSRFRYDFLFIILALTKTRFPQQTLQNPLALMETRLIIKQCPIKPDISPSIIALKSRIAIKQSPKNKRPLQRLDKKTNNKKRQPSPILLRPFSQIKKESLIKLGSS
jgi:hypothetical protein